MNEVKYPCFRCGRDAGFGNPYCSDCRPGRDAYIAKPKQKCESCGDTHECA